jgi:hypothetical protein
MRGVKLADQEKILWDLADIYEMVEVCFPFCSECRNSEQLYTKHHTAVNSAIFCSAALSAS